MHRARCWACPVSCCQGQAVIRTRISFSEFTCSLSLSHASDAIPEFFSLASSWRRRQEWAAPRKPRNPGCGCGAQLLCGTDGVHRGQGQGTGRGFLCDFHRCLFLGRCGTEKCTEAGLAEAGKRGKSWERIQFPMN